MILGRKVMLGRKGGNVRKEGRCSDVRKKGR